MQLLQSWKESLSIFLPKNLTYYAKASWTLFSRSFLIWLGNFWWLLLVAIILKSIPFLISALGGLRYLYLSLPFSPNELTLYFVFTPIFINNIMAFLLLFSWLLTIRESHNMKTFSYYKRFGKHLLYAFLVIIGISILINQLGHFKIWTIQVVNAIILWPLVQGYQSGSFHVGFLKFFYLTAFDPEIIVFPPVLIVLFLLFLCDTTATVKGFIRAVWHSVLLFFYNYPGLYLMTIIMSLPVLFFPYWAFPRLLSVLLLNNHTGSLLALFFAFVYLCFVTCFYNDKRDKIVSGS